MKILNKIIDIILYTIVAIIFTAAIASAIWNKPMLFSAVRSNSMYPLFQRGDMIVINNLSDNDKVSIGDIVVFKAKEGSLASQGYVVHRIVEKDSEGNFITKGDANGYKDPVLKREWIVSKVVTIGKQPVKIPLIGFLPLWMENFQKNKYVFPVIAVILSGIIGFTELSNKKKKKRHESGLELQLIYLFSGLTITIIIAATMLSTSQHIVLPYEVSEINQGILTGSAVGIIKIGDEKSLQLANLNNKGFMPIIATVTSDDTQLSFNHTIEYLKPGCELKIIASLNASKAGNYDTVIHIGLFYPLLPKSIIYNLAEKSYWLALTSISLIPGLPLILYPILDRKLRRKTKKEIRRKFRQKFSRIKSLILN